MEENSTVGVHMAVEPKMTEEPKMAEESIMEEKLDMAEKPDMAEESIMEEKPDMAEEPKMAEKPDMAEESIMEEKPDMAENRNEKKPNESRRRSDSGSTLGLLLSTLMALLAVISQGVFSHKPVRQEDPPHQYSTILVAYDPLIIYIENFMTIQETIHLRNLAEGKFQPSNVTDGKGGHVLSNSRRSWTALLPHEDSVVHSVISRAARFQGFVNTDQFERLQATSYVIGGEYIGHYDLLATNPTYTERKTKLNETNITETDRITTIFAILDDSCGDKCGTQFPGIEVDWESENPKWCQIVDCEEEWLTIKPKLGNAVFWKNLKDDGSAHDKALHAGLPVHKGSKIGLNIWTRNGKYVY